ncbi:DUF4397 domain-containing protein [Algoriphagus faecimaris]|nr:DUF4397 domain-containing protein [Algoriphagus faecimaris]
MKRLTSLKKNGLSWALSMLTIASTFTLSSCLNDFDAPNLPPTSYVSIYQGSPDSPSLDIYADANKINTAELNFSGALAYSPFYVGERRFKISPFNAASALLEKDFLLKPDTIYSLFILNKLSNLDIILVKDEWEEPVAEEAQLRLVHLSPDTEDVLIELSETEEPLTENIGFGENSGFISTPTNTYDIQVKSAVNGEVLVEAPNVELKGNRVYTLVLRGMKETENENRKLDVQLLTNYVHYQ